MGVKDTDWERAHLRVEGNDWRREMPTGRERTLEWKRFRGGERDTLWERAHLIGWEWCG